MRKEDIKLTDLQRILFGEAPPIFLIEVFLRTLIIYIILLVGVKLLGKRMKGQLSVTEMAVMIMLGAIVSVPMQVPDRGLFQGILILLVIVMLQRGIARLGVSSRKVEVMTQGELAILVKDGMMQLSALETAKITKQELFSILREKDIYNLGKVDRVYLEACGLFSIYKSKDEQKPGLSTLPANDDEILSSKPHAENTLVCENCGLTKMEKSKLACSNCQGTEWTKAII